MTKSEYLTSKNYLETMTGKTKFKSFFLLGLYTGVFNIIFQYLIFDLKDISFIEYISSSKGIMNFIGLFFVGVLIGYINFWSAKRSVKKWENKHGVDGID